MDIRNLEINDFWCRLSDRVFSIGLGILPKDIHCTLVFDNLLEDVNFHLTKNTANHNDKPQIKIVIINKEVLYQMAEDILPSFFTNILERFDMKSYREKHNDEVGFISTTEIENSDLEAVFKNAISEAFSDISKIKSAGKKLEIKGDINSKLENFVIKDELVDFIFNTAEAIEESYEKSLDGGILLTQEEATHIFRIDSEWYTFKNLSVFELLSLFVTRKTAYQIICRTINALEVLKEAKTYGDTEKYNYPIRIVLPDTDLDAFICPKCKLSGSEHDLHA
ncbi:hypothetical protein FMM05_13200 [Flavobacterium zepuense]|uniref:Uncharacterized protein n=1 Tax=Flavobacterium zepuense TaxID=2593302 RepID=A0A552UZJ4_9FLAO|nr:hypothetical protein [Flavobacterium zepuense]TRW23612.1 hypothetical protein FMM05_13200 [Flavobacterium zepuense]